LALVALAASLPDRSCDTLDHDDGKVTRSVPKIRPSRSSQVCFLDFFRDKGGIWGTPRRHSGYDVLGGPVQRLPLFCCLLILGACTRFFERETGLAELVSLANVTDPGRLGLLIGSGYDSRLDLAVNRCVIAGEPPALVSDALSSNTNPPLEDGLRVTAVETLTQLYSALGLGATAGLRIGSVRIGGTLTEDIEQAHTSRTGYVVVWARVARPPEVLNTLSLEPFARNALSTGGVREFVRLCGDEFVRGRRRGAEFSGYLRFTASSETTRRAAVETVRATITNVFNGSVTHTAAANTLRTYSDLSVHLFRRGPLRGNPSLDALSLIEYARTFIDSVRSSTDTPATLEALTSPYSIIPGPEGQRLAAIEQPLRVLGELSELKRAGLDRRAVILEYEKWPEQFDVIAAETVQTAKLSLEGILDQLDAAATTCALNLPDPCIPTPAISWPNLVLTDRGGGQAADEIVYRSFLSTVNVSVVFDAISGQLLWHTRTTGPRGTLQATTSHFLPFEGIDGKLWIASIAAAGQTSRRVFRSASTHCITEQTCPPCSGPALCRRDFDPRVYRRLDSDPSFGLTTDKLQLLDQQGRPFLIGLDYRNGRAQLLLFP
jgi:hypothetical protein